MILQLVLHHILTFGHYEIEGGELLGLPLAPSDGFCWGYTIIDDNNDDEGLLMITAR